MQLPELRFQATGIILPNLQNLGTAIPLVLKARYSSRMAVGKVRRRRHRPWRSFSLLHIEQASIERQKGHQEEGR